MIKAGVIATMFWGAAAMLIGVILAAQLSWPKIFYFPDLGFLNFGRLRPAAHLRRRCSRSAATR